LTAGVLMAVSQRPKRRTDMRRKVQYALHETGEGGLASKDVLVCRGSGEMMDRLLQSCRVVVKLTKGGLWLLSVLIEMHEFLERRKRLCLGGARKLEATW
jgi:hypothetical protein